MNFALFDSCSFLPRFNVTLENRLLFLTFFMTTISSLFYLSDTLELTKSVTISNSYYTHDQYHIISSSEMQKIFQFKNSTWCIGKHSCFRCQCRLRRSNGHFEICLFCEEYSMTLVTPYKHNNIFQEIDCYDLPLMTV